MKSTAPTQITNKLRNLQPKSSTTRKSHLMRR